MEESDLFTEMREGRKGCDHFSLSPMARVIVREADGAW